jgi:hypothetical protein
MMRCLVAVAALVVSGGVALAQTGEMRIASLSLDRARSGIFSPYLGRPSRNPPSVNREAGPRLNGPSDLASRLSSVDESWVAAGFWQEAQRLDNSTVLSPFAILASLFSRMHHPL